MTIPEIKTQGKPRTLAEIHRERAAIKRREADLDDAEAALLERAAHLQPSGWISQASSPIGKRRHLEMWRQLRDQKSEGIRAAGKSRLIRSDVFETALTAAEDAPRRHPAEPANDLAAAFGVMPSRVVGGSK